MPYVHGLPPGALVQDSSGNLHLHPQARHRFVPDSIAALVPPTSLTLDIGVHSCGSIACVTYYPLYAITVPQTSSVRRVYVQVRYDEGILLEEVADYDTLDMHARPYRLVRRMEVGSEGV